MGIIHSTASRYFRIEFEGDCGFRFGPYSESFSTIQTKTFSSADPESSSPLNNDGVSCAAAGVDAGAADRQMVAGIVTVENGLAAKVFVAVP